ncbi:STAS/SEC14 domain-containing protein [Gilvimarinus chinensis]|uniref:STAS/SEC14 domain-containing protein n=1 Tax=Gilvimarinus chinensis TaxID=396005 RepID=UPI00037115D7|nr:STAS/SEC14 domain-containing protein [Gilvimarinus chinensis]
MNVHGLQIGITRHENRFLLNLRITGKLTHEDYEKIVPILNNAIADLEDPEIYALVDVSEFQGWELHAAWDDLKLGLKHGSHFHKIAILGNQRWLDMASRVGSWFTEGHVKHFDRLDEALAWL